ncbi:MAG: hypothetical protein ACI8TQ_003411 [Planctomycetota bacterium]|jgi:hypothetical protein
MNKFLLLLIAGFGIAVGIAFQKSQSNAKGLEPPGFTSEESAAIESDDSLEFSSSNENDDPMSSNETWPASIETARQTVLDQSSTLEQKAEALKALQASSSENYADPRSKDILDEAVWVLNNASESKVLNDALNGIEGAKYEPLIEPLIACLLNHKAATVRQNAVRVLKSFSENERVRITLDHAAEYDESEFVRNEAKSE